MKRHHLSALLIMSAALHCVNQPATIDANHATPVNAFTITETNFDSCMTENEFAVIEFYSDKCPVCASLKWVIDSLSNVFSDSVLIGANNTIEDSLYHLFSVTEVPTYLFLKDGKEITRRSFISNKPEVFDTLSELIKHIIDGTIGANTSDTGDTDHSDYLTLYDSTFDSVVLQKGTTAMVFFMYAKGTPCKHMDSVIREFAPNYKNRAIVAKVHAWTDTSFSNLSDIYGINSVPKYQFFKDSVHREELLRGGIQEADTLIKILENLINE